MKEIAVVCVGDKFSPELYISQIYKHLKQHCIEGFRLTVFTDNPARMHEKTGHPIRCVKLPEWHEISSPRQYWWYKICMFMPDVDWLDEHVLYMDLDTIILSNIEKLWDFEPDKFCILQDFNRAFLRDYVVSNSSLIKFKPKDHHNIYTHFVNNITSVIRQFRGDQDYLTWWFKGNDNKVWWPKDWAMSYKWEILHGGTTHGGTNVQYPKDYRYPESTWVVPDECSLVVFHGKPNPYDTEFGKQNLIA